MPSAVAGDWRAAPGSLGYFRVCLLFLTEPRGAVCPPGLLTPLFHAQHATGKHSRSRVFIRRRSWRHPRAVVDRFADLPALYAVHDLCLLLEAGQRAQPKRASKAAKRHAYRGDTGFITGHQ